MRSPITKKASQDEEQNQIITTNINYIQNFVHSRKKLNNKVKMASDKTGTRQNDLNFTGKDMGPVHNKTW